MKAPMPRHERQSGNSLLCLVCFASVLLSIALLGSMRLYGLYLDHRVAYIMNKIEAVTASNAELEERYSALMSPSRIYSFAKTELNMVTATEIETIMLSGSSNSAATYASAKDERPVVIDDLSVGDFIFSFVGIANAQD